MPLLTVITGPTGVGKSAVAVEVAKHFGTEIISADSRQIYRDIPVTTAAPTARMLEAVPHHLVGTRSLDDHYSAAAFEQDALRLLNEIFASHRVAVVCGGSMLYIDALCNGIDELPDISAHTRELVKTIYAREGLDGAFALLKEKDSEYAAIVDKANRQRVLHALEICMESGTTYTSLRTGRRAMRPFTILKFMLTAPREVLFDRINARTRQMVRLGMADEVRAVAGMRHLNSLNTVGVKEMLRYIDGEWTLEEAILRLQKNTRVYAKKQLTWFARDPDIISIDVTKENATDTIILAVGQSLRDTQTAENQEMD